MRFAHLALRENCASFTAHRLPGQGVESAIEQKKALYVNMQCFFGDPKGILSATLSPAAIASLVPHFAMASTFAPGFLSCPALASCSVKPALPSSATGGGHSGFPVRGSNPSYTKIKRHRTKFGVFLLVTPRGFEPL